MRLQINFLLKEMRPSMFLYFASRLETMQVTLIRKNSKKWNNKSIMSKCIELDLIDSYQ